VNLSVAYKIYAQEYRRVQRITSQQTWPDGGTSSVPTMHALQRAQNVYDLTDKRRLQRLQSFLPEHVAGFIKRGLMPRVIDQRRLPSIRDGGAWYTVNK